MEKPTRTIKNGFKVAEELSKAKKPVAMILAFVVSLFLTNSFSNSSSGKK